MIGAVAALALVASASAQTVDGKPEVKAQVLSRIGRLLDHSAYVPGVDFSKWDSLLKEAQPKIDAAKDDAEFQRAINEVLFKFGTSHVVLATPQQGESRRSGATVGIGVSTQQTPDGLVIIRTVKDSPSERAGLIPGDTIVAVEGKKPQGIQGIPGKEGTDVKLTVKHADGKTEDYVLTRRTFSTVRQEELTWPDKDTAKLTVYSFELSYDRERVEKLMTEAQHAKNLILDLRDNGGGAVVNMNHLLGLLMPADRAFGTFVDKDMVEAYVNETHGNPNDPVAVAKWTNEHIRPRKNRTLPPFNGNIVVLVNGFSGSASEIAAEALREEANATIVGTKSAGAVLVSLILPVSNGFQLQIPISDYVTAKGVRLEGTGVKPDIVAEEPKLRLPSAADEAVTKALGFFAQANKGQKTSGQ